LHIGHAKAAILNATAATDYQGTLILRFDDTNPSKESTEFQESQQEDLKTLGVFPNKITFTSNYFDQIEQYCIQIIESGNAYCDDTPVDQMRKERMDGIESASRRRSIQDNLRIFNEMKSYSEEVTPNPCSPPH
jgi:glutamyl-tRNA synthetase